jgi:ABC-type nitrate/sulfonate/bicarbonate transport system substrate-binding protein
MPTGSQAVLDALGDLRVKAILLTHTHPDHWNEYDLVKATAGAPVRCHAAEQIMPADKNDAPVADGEEIAVFGTAGTSTYFNGIAVKSENYPGTYGSIEDLVGTKLGIPGFGTGTWAAFVGFVQSQFGLDATSDFEPVEASPGALLGLLETGEIEGALLFSGQTLAAVGSGDFELVFRFDQEWEAQTGQPVSISMLAARTAWLDENPDLARSVVNALDKATEWMADNTQEFAEGGKYESIAQDAGWLSDEITNMAVQDFIAANTYYTRASLYTDAYIDSTYEFVQVVLENPPPQDEIFYRLD